MEYILRKTFHFPSWSLFEIIWLAIFVSAGTVVTLLTKDSLLNYAILLTGILCIVLAAKGNIWTYVFGLVNSFGYAYVSFINGLYGEMGLNLFFFVPTNIIGFLMWQKHLIGSSVAMRGLKFSQLVHVAIVCVISICFLGFALSQINTQNTPYIDATATILSIVATLLMMWRFKEQWILYIVLNIVTIVMWAIRWVDGSSDGTIMIIMWTAFLVNSVYGYLVWKNGAARKPVEEIAS